MEPHRAAVALGVLCALLALNFGGCIGTVPVVPSGCTPTDGNVNPDPALVDANRVSGEPNDTYRQALDVILDNSSTALIRGAICPTTDDVDIYNLGPMSPGDRIRVDLQGQGGLDVSIAIFDDSNQIFIENDDRAAGDVDSFVNEVVRHASSGYFLAVASSPLAPTTGSYSATIIIGRGGPVAVPNPQPVLLNFGGGTISIPNDRTYIVGPFDSGQIDPIYRGQTAVVKAAIIQTVQENYAGLALEIYDTDTRPAPANLIVSTVFFGGLNLDAYGISQNVDPYNHILFDSSIIFTSDFAPGTFGRFLTPAELGRAIGNITSHEIGHLVGLSHVDNTADIMDTTGGPLTFLADQTFQTSPLHSTIWPFGDQNGAQLLAETLGLSP